MRTNMHTEGGASLHTFLLQLAWYVGGHLQHWVSLARVAPGQAEVQRERLATDQRRIVQAHAAAKLRRSLQVARLGLQGLHCAAAGSHMRPAPARPAGARLGRHRSHIASWSTKTTSNRNSLVVRCTRGPLSGCTSVSAARHIKAAAAPRRLLARALVYIARTCPFLCNLRRESTHGQTVQRWEGKRGQVSNLLHAQEQAGHILLNRSGLGVHCLERLELRNLQVGGTLQTGQTFPGSRESAKTRSRHRAVHKATCRSQRSTSAGRSIGGAALQRHCGGRLSARHTKRFCCAHGVC